MCYWPSMSMTFWPHTVKYPHVKRRKLNRQASSSSLMNYILGTVMSNHVRPHINTVKLWKSTRFAINTCFTHVTRSTFQIWILVLHYSYCVINNCIPSVQEITYRSVWKQYNDVLLVLPYFFFIHIMYALAKQGTSRQQHLTDFRSNQQD